MTRDQATVIAGPDAPPSATRRRQMFPLITFFLLTYAVTWSFFIASGVALSSVSVANRTGILQWLILPGVFAPAVVAIAMTARAAGRAGGRAFLHRLLQWRVGALWVLFPSLYTAATNLPVPLV